MDHLRPVADGESASAESQLSEPPRQGDHAELAALLKRCALGDEAAFAQFYDLTSARAHGLALRVVRNATHAEEVTQEAYLDAWRQCARFDSSRGSAWAWLMTIVHRKAVDRVRTVEAASSREEVWQRESAPVEHDETAETAHASLEGHRVRNAVAQLTPVQRRAVELAYFGGYTHAEVAALLDVPLGTAKTRIRDGLIRLRDALGVAS